MGNAVRPAMTLAGKKIVVTRPLERGRKLAEALEARGATVIEFPTIDIRCVQPEKIPDREGFDWIVFTSANGVSCLTAALTRVGRDVSDYDSAKVCAVGPATKAAAEEAGLEVQLVPETFAAEGIFEALCDRVPDIREVRFFLPRGDIASPYLPERLREAGATVVESVVYETVAPELPESQIDALVEARPDIVTFTSGSTARHYAAMLGPERLAFVNAKAVYAAIGPQTAGEAEKTGMRISIVPEQHDVSGLVTVIESFFANSGSKQEARNP